MKLKNIQMEEMLLSLKPLLDRRDKIGYIAARNTRILSDTLTEYMSFKRELIEQYGEADKDENGKDLDTVSVNPSMPNFDIFIGKFTNIGNIEHEVDLMTLTYEEVIGQLKGDEILKLDWMLKDSEG